MVKVCAIQQGTGIMEKEAGIKANLKLLDEAAKEKPDIVTLCELSSVPFFTGAHKDYCYAWAEPIPGPTTEIFGKKAKELGITLILPLFEKKFETEYFNAAVVIGPDGKLIQGTMPDGRKVNAFHKVHLPSMPTEVLGRAGNDEKFWFKPGDGFPVFKTEKATIGILICYDRWFPESWRTLFLQGADIVFIPTGSWGTEATGQSFINVIRGQATCNSVFAVGCNKGGPETFEGEDRVFFGTSCIIGPVGETLAEAPYGKGPVIISASLDLSKRNPWARWFYKDREPCAYDLGR